MKVYECAFEIAGPTAMFTRPDTGATPVSYPAPTYSAAKAMFEAILRCWTSPGQPLAEPRDRRQRREIRQPVEFGGQLIDHALDQESAEADAAEALLRV